MYSNGYTVPHYAVNLGGVNLKCMDANGHAPIRQTFKFKNNFSAEFSEIVKFGCEILRNVENIVI